MGKGKGNRIFAHIREEVSHDGDEIDNRRIREIHLAGLEGGHVIHRHGMIEEIAIEVEAALIEAYSGLTNAIGGAGSSDYGPMHATEIIRRYAAPVADFISIGRC